MIILYTTNDGKSQIQLRAQDQTVWLTLREIAELFVSFPRAAWECRFTALRCVSGRSAAKSCVTTRRVGTRLHATQLQKLQQIKSACLERMFV